MWASRSAAGQKHHIIITVQEKTSIASKTTGRENEDERSDALYSSLLNQTCLNLLRNESDRNDLLHRARSVKIALGDQFIVLTVLNERITKLEKQVDTSHI